MKILKTLTVVISMVGVFGSSEALAKDGQGTIEEIVNCSQNPVGYNFWGQLLLFKLSDGNWFGTYADYYTKASTDYPTDFATSMVLMAFASKLPVSVRANYSTATHCGQAVSMFHVKKDDYIKIAR